MGSARAKRKRNSTGSCHVRPQQFMIGALFLWFFHLYLSFSATSNNGLFAGSPTVYRHDPQWIRNHPLAFQKDTPLVCDVPPGEGEEGPAGVQGLFKIKTSTEGPVPPVRVFCMVYTHSNRHDVLRSVAETYAPACDGFLAASNLSDPALGAYSIPRSGAESYSNMWNKVRAMWYFVHDHYLLEYDWFHIGGDDMYVIPDNIRRVASQYGQKRPWILGGSIPNSKNPKRRFCGGGAGYTLNRRAVHTLVQRFANECPSAEASDEDVRVGRCLEDVGAKCQDTNDAALEVRYHALDAQFHASWVPSRNSVWLWEKLQYIHGIRANQSQLAQISTTSVSFHLDKGTVRSLALDRGLRRYHAILNDLCGPEFSKAVAAAATCDKETRDEMQLKWKQTPLAKEANVQQGSQIE